jgi:murein DD-endopeptidase MepM/ murein hydrolase activator NlpD
MSCGCDKPVKTDLWTPIPEFRQPTAILPGESIDCYAKRAGTNGKDDVAEKLENRIDNTNLVTDLNLVVNDRFKLTTNSQKVAIAWTARVNGQDINSIFPGIFDQTTGAISGTIPENKANKNYPVLVTAYDAAGEEIDSRTFNFFPKKAGKDETVKFVFPYSPNGRITSPFGPRKPPVDSRTGYTGSSQHNGIDISQPGSVPGDILAAGDGTVVRCGPARGWGNVIFIEHRDPKNALVATTVYGHWENSFVTVGQKVAAGQKIAKEGSAGVSSGAHLHFEMHRGSFGNPVDPVPYLNGTFSSANNSIPGQNSQPDPVAGQTTFANTDRGMTSAEANPENVRCPKDLSSLQTGAEATPNPDAPNVPVNPSTAEVQQKIQQALDESGLAEDDKKLLMFMAKIESGFKADAKNPNSSALGIFQMLDKTAEANFAKIGVPATSKNRNDPYLATKAQIEFYKSEQKKYYDEFQSTGKIAGKTLPPELQSKYAGLSKGEFIYGLIHHDGVGNAVKGNDLQGLGYYRKKTRAA